MAIENHQFIDVLGYNFKYQLAHLGGVYLLSNKIYWDRGICKVGIAKQFGSRMQQYRFCFGPITPVYLFGLIIIAGETKDRRKVEKSILDRFDDIRLPYPDTENDTEWIRHDPVAIKAVFNELRNVKEFGVLKIITNFTAFQHVHQLDLEFAVISKSRKFAEIEYLDGLKQRIPTRLLNLLLLNGRPEPVIDVPDEDPLPNDKVKCHHCNIILSRKSLVRHVKRKHS